MDINYMLDEICAYLRNWFLIRGGVHTGTYTIEPSGAFTPPFLAEDQYYRIIGSLLNDGIHCTGDADLAPETFDGAVWALAIPPQVISVAKEIIAWNADNAATLASPFQSESFGGYSYTMQSTSGADGEQKITWRTMFGSRLSRWRKL